MSKLKYIANIHQYSGISDMVLLANIANVVALDVMLTAWLVSSWNRKQPVVSVMFFVFSNLDYMSPYSEKMFNLLLLLLYIQ